MYCIFSSCFACILLVVVFPYSLSLIPRRPYAADNTMPCHTIVSFLLHCVQVIFNFPISFFYVFFCIFCSWTLSQWLFAVFGVHLKDCLLLDDTVSQCVTDPFPLLAMIVSSIWSCPALLQSSWLIVLSFQLTNWGFFWGICW